MQDSGLIQELPLSVPFFRNKVEAFLQESGLRMEEFDHYYACLSTDGSILAGAGIKADIVKCVAVAPEARSEGLLQPLLSRVVSDAAAVGILNLKVFTKPENSAVFESLGFRVIARAPKAILMENGRGLEKYCDYLRHARPRPGEAPLSFRPSEAPLSFRPSEAPLSFRPSEASGEISSGVIVMNANPFTLGHKYLIDKALEQVDHLFIIPVREDVSAFPYPERLAMLRSAVMPGPDRASAQPSSEENYFSGRCPKNQFSPAVSSPTHASALSVISSGAEGEVEKSHITVLEGSSYVISSATFPTYFLKDLSEAAETQMLLDLDLFERHIMPALGATVRFVGSEPLDPLTARYNSLMHNAVEIPRLVMPGSYTSFMPGCDRASQAISASRVRAAIEAGDYATAAALCPESSHPYLLAALAERALLLELDTPMKPGLVGPDGPGAHSDMDYGVMRRGISALRPFWSRMALASGPDELRQLGIEAESAMLAYTGGVNTHRGAIFALGMAVYVASRRMEVTDIQPFTQKALCEIAQGILRISLNSKELHSTQIGAKRIALTGYRELFEDWLPYYRLCRGDVPVSSANNNADATETGTSPLQNTLLRIMSTLDDTCVIKRVDYDRAQEVKREAAAVLEIPGQAGNDGAQTGNGVMPGSDRASALRNLCVRYAAEGISPGGAADMLALTIFIDSIL